MQRLQNMIVVGLEATVQPMPYVAEGGDLILDLQPTALNVENSICQFAFSLFIRLAARMEALPAPVEQDN